MWNIRQNLDQEIDFADHRRRSLTGNRKYLEPPSLFASLEKESHRVPKSSQAVSWRGRARENDWNERFGVGFSKDNYRFHSNLREYFDFPKKFDTQKKEVFMKSTENCKRLRKEVQGKMRGGRKNGKKKERQMERIREELWMRVFNPISEFNQTRHQSRRVYFQLGGRR